MLIIEGIFQASSSSSHGVGSSRSVSGAVSHLTRTKEGERWTRIGREKMQLKKFPISLQSFPATIVFHTLALLMIEWPRMLSDHFTVPTPRITNNNKKKEEIGLKISLGASFFAFRNNSVSSLPICVNWTSKQKAKGKRGEKFLEALFVFPEIGCREVCCAIMQPRRRQTDSANLKQKHFFAKMFFIHKTGPLINSLLESTKDGCPRETWKLSENPRGSRKQVTNFYIFIYFSNEQAATFYRKDVPASSQACCNMKHSYSRREKLSTDKKSQPINQQPVPRSRTV